MSMHCIGSVVPDVHEDQAPFSGCKHRCDRLGLILMSGRCVYGEGDARQIAYLELRSCCSLVTTGSERTCGRSEREGEGKKRESETSDAISGARSELWRREKATPEANKSELS
eukprot:1399472-Rhodomonas_salina.1